MQLPGSLLFQEVKHAVPPKLCCTAQVGCWRRSAVVSTLPACTYTPKWGHLRPKGPVHPTETSAQWLTVKSWYLENPTPCLIPVGTSAWQVPGVYSAHSLAVVAAQLPLPARCGVQNQAPCHAVLACSHTEMRFRVRTLSLRAVVTSHQPRGTFWRLVVALRTQHEGLEGRQDRQERRNTPCAHRYTPCMYRSARGLQLCLTFSVLPPADQWMRPNPSKGQEWSCMVHTHA